MFFDILTGSEFWTYVGIGFAVQLVDGALGMAYGTLSTAILLSTGLPPVIVSASVHTAQFFTTGFSALSHSYFKNVDRKLFIVLAVAGAVGGMLGALVLTRIDAHIIKPWIQVYLLILGFLILSKLWKIRNLDFAGGKPATQSLFRSILGFFTGFLDALGGGWGPIVTSTLMVKGENPRAVIGSVNTAEFFVKTVIAMTLISSMGIHFPVIVLGLLAGGVIAAPLGAYVLRFLKPQILMGGVGLLLVGLSLYMLVPMILGQ